MDLLALYGAIVATSVAAWDIVKWRAERPRLKVDCYLAKMVGNMCVPSGGTVYLGQNETPEEDARRPRFVAYNIQNHGGVPIAIHNIGGRFNDGQHFMHVPGVIKLPHTLAPGESVLVPTPPDDLALNTVSEFSVTDGLGRRWTCSPNVVRRQHAALPVRST